MTDGTRTPAGRHPVQSAALGVSIVFLLIGVLGFIPGVTTGYDQLAFAGYRSDALLLGLFNVSVLHNLVHLLFGIIGLAMARTPLAARQFLIYGGAVYAVLFVYGLLIGQASPANFVPVNTADNWLHLILAIGMIGLGALLSRDLTRGAARM